VLFDETDDRIQRGLMAAGLPFVVESLSSVDEAQLAESETVEAQEYGSMGEES